VPGGFDMTNADDDGRERLPEGAHTDFRESMTYGDYLQLDSILDAQRPLAGKHDEMLFLIIHQSSELWMKLVLHELSAAVRVLRDEDDIRPAFKMLARVSRIQSQLIQSWDVLATLTPADYLTFRDSLGHASGFQSYQYRMIEFILGNKNRGLLEPHRDRPEIHARLKGVLESPGLYDEVIRKLARRGFKIAPEALDRDWSRSYREHESVVQAWAEIYRNTSEYWDLYELGEELVDLEDWFQQWRFRHRTTVERIIGFKRGTGGTAGVQYLQKALETRFFPELWSVRTVL
jgi:tryptophan 2,3-dioxygenase